MSSSTARRTAAGQPVAAAAAGRYRLSMRLCGDLRKRQVARWSIWCDRAAEAHRLACRQRRRGARIGVSTCRKAAAAQWLEAVGRFRRHAAASRRDDRRAQLLGESACLARPPARRAALSVPVPDPGRKRAGHLGNMVLQLPGRDHRLGRGTGSRGAVGRAGAAAAVARDLGLAVVALQSVPLPQSLWPHLGGARGSPRVIRCSAIPAPALPLSLTPYASLSTCCCMIPPLADVLRDRAAESAIAAVLAAALLAGRFRDHARRLQVASSVDRFALVSLSREPISAPASASSPTPTTWRPCWSSLAVPRRARRRGKRREPAALFGASSRSHAGAALVIIVGMRSTGRSPAIAWSFRCSSRARSSSFRPAAARNCRDGPRGCGAGRRHRVALANSAIGSVTLQPGGGEFGSVARADPGHDPAALPRTISRGAPASVHSVDVYPLYEDPMRRHDDICVHAHNDLCRAGARAGLAGYPWSLPCSCSGGSGGAARMVNR